MIDDLVERLRDFDPHLHEWEVVDEAADRIEGLEENQRFIIQERDRTFALMLARAEKAEADNARLREAIDYILDGMGIYEPDYVIDPEDDFLDVANSKWVRDTLERLAAALNTGKESSK